MADYQDGRYEIASVLSRAFQTVGANLPLFLGLSLVLAGVPSFASMWWQLDAVQVTASASPESLADFNVLTYWPVWVSWLVATAAGAVLQAALTRATVQHLSGETPDFTRCLLVGLRLFLPLVAIGLLYGIGVGFGLILLVIPGILLALAWIVTVPAYVQERIGVFGAFSRSGELTRGARFRIFLTMLVVLFGLWLLSIPVGMITAAIQAATGSPILLAATSAVVGALSSMLTTTIQASIYVELREVKEGVAPADLEAIFA